MKPVWIVSTEWNIAPSEVTGETGIIGVFATERAAQLAGAKERAEYDAGGQTVYNYSQDEYAYCAWCGEACKRDELGKPQECPCEKANDPGAYDFCHHCGAELTDSKDCNNDHDEWDIDIHVTEHTVQP